MWCLSAAPELSLALVLIQEEDHAPVKERTPHPQQNCSLTTSQHHGASSAPVHTGKTAQTVNMCNNTGTAKSILNFFFSDDAAVTMGMKKELHTSHLNSNAFVSGNVFVFFIISLQIK